MLTKQKGNAWIWVLIVIAVVLLGYVAFSGDSEMNDDEATTDPTPATYTVTITNRSENQPLSPGVYAVHTGEVSLNFKDQMAPESLEPLAEWGDHTAFADFVRNAEHVVSTYTIDAPILPGESYSFDIMALPGQLLSGVQMAVASNDGFTLFDRISIMDGVGANAANFDAGTEENSPLGSGFTGGQPDPERGEENIDNGTPSAPQETVMLHPQLTSVIANVSIVEKQAAASANTDADMDDGDMEDAE